ncbi:hypothetical protein GEV33_001276 [Tenebrio molitor]|uniref:Uncharacterized protein n=1 Tax=Tenebrio molitor TaxID=7067 RepID=A0A8J6HV92_TENMO|nr:hypothetical protein GEV33_001554 [Tenebrio molitor]KAH0821515.1 hypothetical protein GEV33_001276 [Tenebrio molitor]
MSVLLKRLPRYSWTFLESGKRPDMPEMTTSSPGGAEESHRLYSKSGSPDLA